MKNQKQNQNQVTRSHTKKSHDQSKAKHTSRPSRRDRRVAYEKKMASKRNQWALAAHKKEVQKWSEEQSHIKEISKKVLFVGFETINGKKQKVFLKVSVRRGKRELLILSISGVVGPQASGNCKGSCGQILDVLSSEDFTPAKGWTSETVLELAHAWKEYHLNDLVAGCSHQQEWDTKAIIPELEKRVISVFNYEHEDGLLCKPCPVCGYQWGSSWLSKKIPEEVIEFLRELPESSVTPAWV